MPRFALPDAPADLAGPVKAWSEPVLIPTYLPDAPDLNPMFLENRVYQGSSGCVYPLPFIDRIATEPCDRSWQAIHIENEFVRLMVLPEIGGRIHIGLDKTNGYDFFYRQNVIKPALVGLAGPWISGGVEFNWPQHHRPATYMPVDWSIEEHPDGSRTIWLSDHDPLNRLKGMHGVCLHPGKSYLELKVRLYNRTPFVQTFLWWANAAVRVHDKYQSFFPPDVHYVADHARRAISTYPLCEGTYYGIDYGARGYPANDLSWYSNIPAPTSYMAAGSKYDFVGGYDHAAEAGVIHVANHYISPGKKQWTWGNHPFGYAWDRNLTDEDGPYIELMAGVYTDNQPDFSFLAPWETKTFRQFWYPIRKIGPPQMANRDAALSLRPEGIGVSVSAVFPNATIRLLREGKTVAHWTADLAPDAPFVRESRKQADSAIVEVEGRELIRYAVRPPGRGAPPKPAVAPSPPGQVKTNDELYHIGLHLEQYRHATRSAEPYWEEVLRRDPHDPRALNALGRSYLRNGEFKLAALHFGLAIDGLTRLNGNPYDGEPHYNLGLALRYLGFDDEAYAAFYKATWNYAWRTAGYTALAEIDAKHERWTSALDHLALALRTDADHVNGRNLQAAILRRLGQDASAVIRETLALDPLNLWARHLANGCVPSDPQMQLDLAFDYARAGLNREAAGVLTGSHPMVLYTRAYLTGGSYAEARRAKPDYCFPNRLEEMLVLEAAIAAEPRDARALYYLGNLLYGRRRHEEAMRRWEDSAEIDPGFSVVWRNLGIGWYNVRRNPRKAAAAFNKALAANPHDGRVLYERDQLWKRLGKTPRQRLAELERRRDLVNRRDDLSVELASLYNQTGQHRRALDVMLSRRFAPWEGGEGRALEQWMRAAKALGLPTDDPPESLGEVAHPLAGSPKLKPDVGYFATSLPDLLLFHDPQ
jgi:tetratricopeptide (TPR) repeat protein